MTDNAEDNEGIIGWIEFEYSGSVQVYADDPLAVRVAAMTSDELQEHFGPDAYECIDRCHFDWQPL